MEFYIILLNFNVNKQFLFFGINFPKRDTLVTKKKKKERKERKKERKKEKMNITIECFIFELF